MASNKRITWLPALPDEGWASMDRYWLELTKCANAVENLPFTIETPSWLGAAPEKSSSSGRWSRALRKYFVYPRRVRKIKADLVHVLDHSYAHLIPNVPKKTKIVATVFDLIPLEANQGMGVAQVERFRRSVESLKHADHLISISAETKGKLQSMLGIAGEKITVAVPGMDFAAFNTPVSTSNVVAQAMTELPPIIFSVGTTLDRKNLKSLLPIFKELSEEFKARRCVFVRAGSRLPETLRDQFHELLGLEGFVELGPLFGADLIAVYQRARIFVFPSTLEGLTFTIPEAMAAGCAVVTNRCTANPEAGGDAALYYDEGDASGAAALIRRLLSDENYFQQIKTSGLARASKLTWHRHFEIVQDVYKRLLS